MEPTHHEPWDTMHDAAHAYAVERLEEAIDKARQAAGWIAILPETSEHVTAMMAAISNQLLSVLNQVDRPTGLADFDKEVEHLGPNDPLTGSDLPHQSLLRDKIRQAGEQVERKLLGQDIETGLLDQSKRKLYRFDEHGDSKRST